MVFLMSSPTSPALQQLHHLDRSSPDFHDQLCSALHGEEYTQCVQNLQGDDLVWVVDYLDKVRRRVAFPYSPLNRRRLLMVSIVPVQLSPIVYVDSEADAVLEGYFQHRTHLRLTF